MSIQRFEYQIVTMQNKQLSQEEIEALSHEDLTDLVVAVAHGRSNQALPPVLELVDLLGVGQAVATSYDVDAVNAHDLDIETVCDSLRDQVSKKRLREIKDGSPLNRDERRLVSIKNTNSGQWEGGGTTDYYEIVDRNGRKAYFSEENTDDLGMWGPSDGWSGPTSELPSTESCEEQDEDGNIFVFKLH